MSMINSNQFISGKKQNKLKYKLNNRSIKIPKRCRILKKV